MARWHFLLSLALLSLLIACNPATTDRSPTPDANSPEAPADSATPDDTAPQTADPTTAAADDHSPVADQLSDTTIVPGDRVGPITSDTSRADLTDLFGEAALEDTEVAVGEGFTESGTVVAADSDHTFAVIWVDDSHSEPATVKDFGPAWQTPEGIGIGTSFAELREILGPFELYGFGWDYGGTLVLEGSNLGDYYGSLILRVQPSDPDLFQQQGDAFRALQGDKLLSSTDPFLSDLDLVVDEMIVYINPPAE